MPPKQDSNADCITALEGQFGSLTSLIEDMRAEMKANHQHSLEIEKRAEEHQRQASEEKQMRVETVATPNPDQPRSVQEATVETRRPISDGSQPQ